MEVYIEGKRVRIDPARSIGKGGEADVFDIGGGVAIKIFKSPNHLDLNGLPDEQIAARERIATHQKKLVVFPTGLPPHVVTPKRLAYDRAGMIMGYTMPLLSGCEVLLRYSERLFREAVASHGTVAHIFSDLHTTVQGLHNRGVVIGDFNDLNVLVSGEDAYLIDADSFQFGSFLCNMFTARFADPLLCDSHATSMVLMRPHNPESDWYAYTVMLMQCLLYVGPYGGVYRPTKGGLQIAHDARPLRRITIFSPDVKYPKVGISWKTLPDDLLQVFHDVFEKDKRGPFPRKLIDGLRWVTCASCKTEHARAVCPTCALVTPPSVREVVRVRGRVTATRIFHTNGLILFAAVQNGELMWLYHEGGVGGLVRRESGTEITHMSPGAQWRFRIAGERTVLGRDGLMFVYEPNNSNPERYGVDMYGTLPIFDANEQDVYWVDNGRLQRSDTVGPKYIGDVIRAQTLFWVGPTFGFGFSRAGELQQGFVFDARARGINDRVELPRLRGQLVDSSCSFTSNRCWFFVAMQDRGKTVHHCMVIGRDGTLEATAEVDPVGDSWLATIRGKCAFGDSLFSATDEGIVRVRIENGTIVQTQVFPDTEPFVSAHDHLFAVKNGIAVVGPKDIHVLRIA